MQGCTTSYLCKNGDPRWIQEKRDLEKKKRPSYLLRDKGRFRENSALLDDLLIADLELQGKLRVVLYGRVSKGQDTISAGAGISKPGRCRAWFRQPLQQSS